MKYSLLVCLSLFFGYAQGQSYNPSSVPEELKKNASVIVHLDNTSVEVEDIDKATVKVERVFTVLSEEGKDALFFNQYCNKYVSLDDAEIKVYDKNGKQTAKVKRKEMASHAVGEGLVEDGFLIYYPITAPVYPVTVECNYTVKLKSILSLPAFRFIDSKEGVVEANYSIKYPAQINIRYKPKLTSVSPQTADDGKYKILKWTVKNLAVIEDEEGSVSERDKFPYVDITADQFSYYGNQGDLSSWKAFGSWINNLYSGLDELAPARKQFFQDMVKDAPNDVEKIRRIYHYLQENFRYVSIQLGVGGLKPFSASFTDDKKYGDCKALSNYMKAALKAVGITSHVAIINAEYNEEPVDSDFPANNFNHVILCVPQPKDSIWLECTSSTTEFNQLGTFTENRNALLITDNGGVLVSTPKSRASENILTTHTVVTMETDLSGSTETVFTTKGEYQEMMASVLKEKKDDQKEFMVLGMGFKEPDEIVLEKTGQEDGQTKMLMAVRKVPEFTAGDKYFINPHINKIIARPLPKAENRKLDFYFKCPYEKRDTTIIKLPSNFHPDVFPKERTLSTAYTNYEFKSWYNEKENAIYTVTTLILKKHKIPAADYAAIKNFFDDVSKDDAQRVVVKKTGEASSEKKTF